MQGVLFHLVGTVWPGRDVQFLVAVVNVLLLVLVAVRFDHGGPDGAVGAVRGKKEPRLHAFHGSVAGFKSRSAGLQVYVHASAVKVEVHVAALLRQGHQLFVQTAAGHGIDGLAVLSVGLAHQGAIYGVHHAVAHGDGFPGNGLRQSGALQGLPAAVGKGQIDAASAGVACLAGIRPTLVYVHSVAAFGQQGGPQRADESGSNYSCFFHGVKSSNRMDSRRDRSSKEL